MKKDNYAYVIKNLSKSFRNGKEIIKTNNLSFLYGAKIGILGVNGSGKSTLLKIMAGLDNDYIGEAWASKGMRIGYLSQEPELDNNQSVKENILSSFKKIMDLINNFNLVSNKLGNIDDPILLEELILKQAELQEEIDKLDGWELDRKVEIAMTSLSCPKSDLVVGKLSGGEKRRVAICKLLLEEPDILLLDEPTNHLDAETISWLEKKLFNFKGTIIAVTHDRYFLDNVANWILEIDKSRLIPFHGNYSSWLEAKYLRMQIETSSQQSLKKTIGQELDWVRSSAKGRNVKNQARVNAYKSLVKKSEINEKTTTLNQIFIPSGKRLGEKVLKVSNLSKIIQEKTIINNLSFNIVPGAIIGIIGPNGAGKTTLLDIISKKIQYDSGNIEYGDTVKIGYVDQLRDDLNSQNTVWQEITDEVEEITLGNKGISSRAYVSWYNFRGTDQQKIVGNLSGGERNRVQLAKILKSESNLIILDEPTNDLDVDTLRSLENAIINFAGCVIVTSHDRYFLDRICTNILAFEGNGRTVFFSGTYNEYEQNKRSNVLEN